MKKFFKYIKIALASALGLIALVIFLVIFGEGMAKSWRLMTFSHPAEVGGIQVGDKVSDLVFKHGLGKPYPKDKKKVKYEALTAQFSIDTFNKVYLISFAPNSQNTKYTRRTFPIKTADDLLSKFGEPEIYSSSSDHLVRRYTYSDDKLQSGVTYMFTQGKLVQIMVGQISWRMASDVAGRTNEYIVNGQIFCPGLNCPLKNGELKPEWENKSVRDLVALD